MFWFPNEEFTGSWVTGVVYIWAGRVQLDLLLWSGLSSHFTVCRAWTPGGSSTSTVTWSSTRTSPRPLIGWRTSRASYSTARTSVRLPRRTWRGNWTPFRFVPVFFLARLHFELHKKCNQINVGCQKCIWKNCFLVVTFKIWIAYFSYSFQDFNCMPKTQISVQFINLPTNYNFNTHLIQVGHFLSLVGVFFIDATWFLQLNWGL